MQKGFLDFENPGALSDIDYHRLTGISGANFNNLFSCVKSEIRSTLGRSAHTCIAILLMKLRTELSHSILSTLFDLPRRTIGRAIHSAKKALMKCFVPMHLDLDHITRNNFVKQHTRDLKDLFAEGEDVAILVADRMGSSQLRTFPIGHDDISRSDTDPIEHSPDRTHAFAPCF